MKRGNLILNCAVTLAALFLLTALLSPSAASLEEFSSCSLDSNCKVNVCSENSCVNQSYQTPGCTTHNFPAKECRCVDNVCSVLVGSVVPVCNAENPDTTYCKDEKTLMTCDAQTWVSKACEYKCENGQCLTISCNKNEDCGTASYTKKYCSKNEVCLDTITPICLNPGTLNSICSSSSAASCTPCTSGCYNGICSEGTTSQTICQASTKCMDGTLSECKLVDNQCVCTSCPAILQPFPQPTQICIDTDSNNFYEKGIMHGVNDPGHWDSCGDSSTLTEYYCENNEARKTAFNCPNGCKDGACIKSEPISEQITCIFKNSDREQKCYLSEYNERYSCSGKENCTMNVVGYAREKMVWKSTCGSYIPTIINGQDENAEFECKFGETTTTQIKNKGFRNAYFQCYDGEESKSTEREACKTAEFWKKFAENFCQSHCKNEKCGVNSFSIANECYIGETTARAVPVNTNATSQTPKGMLYYFKADNCQYCQKMDEELGILKQGGFFNNFGVAILNIENKEVSEKYKIKAVPTLILYKDKCSFRKEGLMKSEEIENWAYESNCDEEIKETNETAEPALVCKDSCPLNKKCYPFGYRKSGKYCSEEGSFEEQAISEKQCDNSFECSSNLCISGKCISEGLIKKVLGWFRNIFGGKEAEIMDCGGDTKCWENAFKVCKPAKISQQGVSRESKLGGMVIEILGLKDKKCVVKWTAKIEGNKESMECKFENYTLGMKDMGSKSLEQYCEGKLTYWLSSSSKLSSSK